MANKQSDKENVNWKDIPPIMWLFLLILMSGFFLNASSVGAGSKTLILIMSSVGVLYFAIRFKQIYDEQGIDKAFQWVMTPLGDRDKDQFSSPSLKPVMPERTTKKTEEDVTLEKLRAMDDYEFEKLIAKIWEELGFETQVTQASNDRGIDVIAEKDHIYHEKKIIQAKRYAKGNKIGSEQVQRYDSLRRQEDNVDEVIIVTTSSFTKPAKRTAKDLNVKPVNGNDLLELYQENIKD